MLSAYQQNINNDELHGGEGNQESESSCSRQAGERPREGWYTPRGGASTGTASEHNICSAGCAEVAQIESDTGRTMAAVCSAYHRREA